jgi:hypothetical protein
MRATYKTNVGSTSKPVVPTPSARLPFHQAFMATKLWMHPTTNQGEASPSNLASCCICNLALLSSANTRHRTHEPQVLFPPAFFFANLLRLVSKLHHSWQRRHTVTTKERPRRTHSTLKPSSSHTFSKQFFHAVYGVLHV